MKKLLTLLLFIPAILPAQTQAPQQTENEALQEQATVISSTEKDREAQHNELAATHQRLSQELAQLRRTAANAIAIDEHNRKLQQQVVTLERALRIAKQENQSLSDGNRQTWFLLGALVLIGGIAIGLLLPRLQFQRRNRWGEL